MPWSPSRHRCFPSAIDAPYAVGVDGTHVELPDGRREWRPFCRVTGCGEVIGDDTALEVVISLGTVERVIEVPICPGHYQLISAGRAELSVSAA
jgi:hypothetical protein